MKVTMGFFKCMESMARDMRHPYIPSTTVLGDIPLHNPNVLIFHLQHHCRACGRIFCNDCTKHRIALSHLGYYMPVRVCDECYSKLHGAQKTKETDVWKCVQ